jgi:hypothetical protein
MPTDMVADLGGEASDQGIRATGPSHPAACFT